jgi:hypothetical protein
LLDDITILQHMLAADGLPWKNSTLSLDTLRFLVLSRNHHKFLLDKTPFSYTIVQRYNYTIRQRYNFRKEAGCR